MLESFQVAFNAVMPFLIYLMVGWGIVRLGWTDKAFLDQLNRLVFKVIYPFMMFQNVYGTTRDTIPSLRLIALIVISLLGLIALLMVTVPRFVRENPRRGVVVQAIFRSNYVLYGVPLTAFVFGDVGSAQAGFVALIVVAIFNIGAVVVLEHFNSEGGKTSVGRLLLRLAQNPLLQGCLLGLVFVMTGLKLPVFLEKPVSALAGTATPIAMICLGGTLRFSEVKRNAQVLSVSLAIKLVLLPLLLLSVGWLLGLRGVELFLILMVFGTPVATSSYPMAQNMGGDGELAGQFVFISTVISLGTIFLFIFCMSRLGILMG